MIAATLGEQKRAKIKFFAVYIASVFLIIVIISSLWKTSEAALPVGNTQASLPPTNEKLLREDALLHRNLEALDNQYSLALAAGKSGIDAQRNNLQSAENGFKTTLDSLEKGATAVEDADQRTALVTMLAGFRKSFESRSKLMNDYTMLLADTTRSAVAIQSIPATNNEEMQELKAILVEKEEKTAALEKKRVDDLAAKDRIIASLQTQVAKKQNVPVQSNTVTSDGDGEWKQKYSKLKASFDNMAAQNNTLSKSYKSIVDDNRRLLSQLQAARKQ